MIYSANKLRFTANVISANGEQTVATGVPCGLEFLAGRRLEQAQGQSANTSHMIVFRTVDAADVTDFSYLDIEDVRYVVDFSNDAFLTDPKNSRGAWLEVFAHVDRGNA